MRTSNDFLTPAQEKKLKELGDYLNELRTQRNCSVALLAQRTRIQERLIRAIEAAEMEELPEPIYIQALIRRMGDALGVDGQRLCQAFPINPNLRAIKPSWKPVKKPLLRPFHMYLIYVAVLIGMVSGVSLLVSQPGEQLAETETETEAAIAPSPTQPAVADSTAPQPAIQDVSQTDEVVVTMELQEASWLRIEADGTVAYEGILPKGEQRTWRAQEQIKVIAGNAGGVVVTINNESEAKPLGNPGAVQTVTYHSPKDEPS
jgi:cytoskeletal protein RodZ